MNKKVIITVLLFHMVFCSFGLRHPLYAQQVHHNQHEKRHDEDAHSRLLKLNEEELHELNIQLGKAQPGILTLHVTLPGKVVLNNDKHAHIVPRVPGIVTQVRKKLGDSVEQGEVIAIVESNDLADAKATYLAYLERVELAELNFEREKSLVKKNISSKKEFFEAKQTLAEAKIGLRSSKQKLLALGFSENFLDRLPNLSEISYTRYELTAPFDGIVINKHITLGELITSETQVFEIANLDTVWVDLSVYPKDLPFIKKGQEVTISASYGMFDIKTEITYVGSIVHEQTRTALARVTIPNDNGRWRPGTFVTAEVTIEEIDVPIILPKTAIYTLDGKLCVFIKTEEGFKAMRIKKGRSDKTSVEIVAGVECGAIYVKKGGFMLKSELEKEAFAGNSHDH